MMVAVVGLAAYVVALAASVRCEPAGASDVYSIADLDVLPQAVSFTLAQPALVPGAPARRVVLRAGRSLHIAGMAADPAGGSGAPAVFAIVDGNAIATTSGPQQRFTVIVPPAALATGKHSVSFDVVASDLSGYAIPQTSFEVLVR